MSFFLIFFTAIGLFIGSFLAAFSYRLPKRISIAKGRSFCPKCKSTIHWFDNIPLFSYLILKGKCRNCKKHISLRYPMIELSTSLGFLYVSYHYFPDYSAILFYLIVYCVLVLIFVIDLEHQIIPDILIFFGFLAVILYSLLTNSYFLPALFAGFFAAGLLMLIHLFTRGLGMGLGDVKFAVFGGFLTGVDLFLVWLFLSFLTGGIAGSILIVSRRAGLKDKIAFGPFLVIGLVLTIIFGKKILSFLGF